MVVTNICKKKGLHHQIVKSFSTYQQCEEIKGVWGALSPLSKDILDADNLLIKIKQPSDNFFFECIHEEATETL